MFVKKILIPYDLSENSRESLFYGERFLKQSSDHELVVVHALPLVSLSLYGEAEMTLGLPPEIIPSLENKIRSELHSLGYSSNLLNQVHIRVIWGDPVSVILEQAADCDLVALTTHGYKGIKKLLLGSVTEKIVRHAQIPVMVVRSAQKCFPKSIVVPVNLEENTYEVLKKLLSLYPEDQHEYHIVHVIGESDLLGMYQQILDQPLLLDESLLFKAAQNKIGQLVKKVFNQPVRTSILTGSVSLEVTAYAATQEADLLVLPTHHKGPIGRFLLGSEADTIVREASGNVLCFGL